MFSRLPWVGGTIRSRKEEAVHVSWIWKMASRVSLSLPGFSQFHVTRARPHECLLSILQLGQFVLHFLSHGVNPESQQFLVAVTFYRSPPSNQQGYTCKSERDINTYGTIRFFYMARVFLVFLLFKGGVKQ
nr:hypothetical protein Iba_chr12bCG1680 [Ipomoea batatas]